MGESISSDPPGGAGPLVSAIIIFLNGERFLQEAIDSVLNQTYDHWELLLVDDGSMDRSTEIAQRYAASCPQNIRYLYHPGRRNRGMSSSRNLGLAHARGEFIAFLDHDDVWLPNKLSDQVAILEAFPHVGLTYGKTRYWHSWTGRPEDRQRDGYTALRVEPNTVVAPPALLTLLLKDETSVASTCSILFRRIVAEQVGGFDESFRDQYEDMVFLSKMYLETPVFVAGESWDCYRQRPSNSTALALRIGHWHPKLPNPAREAFLNRVEQHLLTKTVSDASLLETLRIELQPYRRPDELALNTRFCYACYDAGRALLRAGHATTALRSLADARAPDLDARDVAKWLFDAVPVAIGQSREVWDSLWTVLAQRVSKFLAALEAQADAPGLADLATFLLERMVRNNMVLRVAEGNVASLMMSPDNTGGARINIDHVASDKAYDIQLNMPRLLIRANNNYSLCFQARSDAPRMLFAGCSRAHDPWSNLGLYERVALTTDWKEFAIEFDAADDDDNARIHFDVGACETSVDIRSIALRRLHDGALVEPDGGQPARRPLTPTSRNWGFDRGQPVDRYFIEGFLAAHAADIRGRVLEVGDDSYTRRFGANRVTKSDVLHIAEGNPLATIVANLADANHIPSDVFDCVILTQTLQLVYDVRAAVATVCRILKPGGVVLATVPGISQTYDSEWRDSWYWNFTTRSVRRLFDEHFPPDGTSIESFGNVLTAMSFIDGLAAEDLNRAELEYHDPDFEVLIAVRALRAPA